MTAQERPFVSLAAGDEFCAAAKCLRKCQRLNKPDHYHHAHHGDACHEGACWPADKSAKRADRG
jgi:hypothetical protein